MRHCGWAEGLVVVGIIFTATSSSRAAPLTLYVNASDPGCEGGAPCYPTMQAAVTAAQPGYRVVVQAGHYAEQVSVRGKNNAADATETDRIVIEADPEAAPGSVVVIGVGAQCADGFAFRFRQSRFVTLRGFTITGAGGQAIALMGGANQNQDIHIERVRIFGNGSDECDGGITIARGNPRTLIANSLIYGNGRNGLNFVDADGGPHYVIANTIHGNAWSGVNVARSHEVFLLNNAITGNGTARGSAKERFGVQRETSTALEPAGIHLLHNLVCGNRLGEINGPALDSTDSGNLTPGGGEGPGVLASPGCESAAAVYANVNGTDHLANSADDDFTLASGSPAIDRGLDPRAMGLPVSLNSLLEADFAGDGARPQPGVQGGTTRFDIGALERLAPDLVAPTVSFFQPAASAFVRRSVMVGVQATDSGGVASLGLSADSQPLTATLTPPPPAPTITATAAWDTTGFADGTHTLAADAVDQAGNTASGQRVLIVDNTPPDTEITGGPSDAITGSTVTFTFTGTDNVSAAANLLFSWRLDGDPFSAFSSITSATLTGLTGGPHTFDVKALDQAGNEDPLPARRSFTITQLSVAITDPEAGATVPPGSVLVRGTVRAAGAEVGVAVNGVPAALAGTTFAAVVPVTQTTTTLTATVVTTSGVTASESIVIAVPATSDYPLTLRPNSTSGIAPLAITFSVSGSPSPLSVELDYDGDGTSDFSGTSLDGQVFIYAEPGLYFPRATITDAEGHRLTVGALVQVYDRVAFDFSLQSKWAALKNAAQQGDIPRALDVIALTARDGYSERLTALTIPLSQINAVLGHISLVQHESGRAEYQMIRVDNGVPLSHFVLFVQDTDGLWRLRFF